MSTIRLEPMGDRVVIRPTAEGEAMRGGLYIPDVAREKPMTGKVIAIGNAVAHLTGGDEVVYAKYAGTTFTLNGEDVIVLAERDVLARVHPQ
jgi:chaperonin GroES